MTTDPSRLSIEQTQICSKPLSPRYIPVKRYSEALKRKIVSEIERGLHTKASATKHYRIDGHSTVARWCRTYSKYRLTGIRVELVMTEETRERKRQEELTAARRRIQDLERLLANADLRNASLEVLLEIGKTDYGIDLKKKRGSEGLST
jgi:transposase